MNLHHLHCIDLDQPQLEGFRQFISAWLYRDGSTSLLVDPGPLSTIPTLLERLDHHGVDHLDYVLLTHIHIDHAGGTGALLQAFPDARVICHPEGIPHLVSPDKLWQGSRKVLGPLAETYGEIGAVPADKIHFADTLVGGDIRVFQTPGHAAHHLSYLVDDLLFAGEVAGVRNEVAGGIYMRPATPPRFILQVALDSIDRLLALAPKRMVFAHYGLVDDAPRHLQMGRHQLKLWVRGAVETIDSEPDVREARLMNWLLAHDPIFRNMSKLPTDIQARERYFLGNTFKGILDYVDRLSTLEQEQLLSF